MSSRKRKHDPYGAKNAIDRFKEWVRRRGEQEDRKVKYQTLMLTIGIKRANRG